MSQNTNANLLVSTTILQIIVGATVIVGGAALIYFSIDPTGKALGIVHAVLGILGLSSGILLLAKNRRAWTLTFWSDILIIAFSATSEVALSFASSLPRDAFVDSIIGTTVAIGLALIVIAMAAKANLTPFSPKDAGLEFERNTTSVWSRRHQVQPCLQRQRS